MSLGTIAAGLGCPSRQVSTGPQLLSVLDEILPISAARAEPLLVEVVLR